MPLLSNEYLNAERLRKWLLSQTVIHLKGIKKTINSIFSDAFLSPDEAFNDYPHLRELLIYLLSLPENATVTTLNLPQGADALPIEKINQQWQLLNTQYGYFITENINAQNLFNTLTEACRAIIIFIEKNNTHEDTMAYEYAYKLMALYVDDMEILDIETCFKNISKQANQLVREFTKSGHPYHDVLLTKLNLPNAYQLKDKKGWRNLILSHGVKVFPAFVMADKIEEKNANQAPKNLNNAKFLLAQCQYQRADEDSEFATLCHLYQFNEEGFNL